MSKTGPEFWEAGRQQLHDHLIIEDASESLIEGLTASDAVLVAMTSGLNVALIGEPGGGKSVLSSDSYRIVEGIQFDDVAKVPHTADLTAERLIGATAVTIKTTTSRDVPVREEVSAELKPLLHPDTKVIWLDEVNRVNPFAVNGVLGALENGKVITDAGVLTLNGLEWAISTMNPHNKSQATFQLDAAVVSRHAIGMVMGDEKSHQDCDKADAILDGILINNWMPNPEKIEPVISLPELHALREKGNGIVIAENDKKLPRKLIGQMLTTWRDHEVSEAKGRAAMQLSKVARALGVLRNSEPTITDKDWRDAAKLVSCARLAMGARLDYSELSSELTAIVE